MVTINAQRGSEYSVDFHRPITSAAIQALDPGLELVWNRKYGLFQVIRWSKILVRPLLVTIGRVCWMERVPFWECDVEDRHGLADADNPIPLLTDMLAGDTREHPELLSDSHRLELGIAIREKLEAKMRDEWGHATRWNRRQLQRVWSRFYDHPAIVR